MNKTDYTGIWVFAEQEEGALSETSLELLAKAAELKAKLGGSDTVSAILLGGRVSPLCEKLFAFGAEQVIMVESSALSVYKHRPYTEAVTALAEKYRPSIFLFPASPIGRELAPRIMCRLNTGLTADAIDLDIDEDGVFVQTTPNYGGKILSHITIPDRRPQMVTVHPKVFSPVEKKNRVNGPVISEDIPLEDDEAFVILDTEDKPVTGKSVAAANIVVAAGRGVKTREDLNMLEELAEIIGQSGATVKPELIINVGISGSVQYVAGMQKAKCVISINHTAGAPIFDVSHYGAVMDYTKLIPEIIAEISRRKS